MSLGRRRWVGFAGGTWSRHRRRLLAAAVETVPISIVLPAGSPPWSAVSFTRRAVTVAFADRGGSCTVSTMEPSSSRLPQSASGMTTFADGVMSCPSTVRPVSDEAETFAEEFADPAAHSPARRGSRR